MRAPMHKQRGVAALMSVLFLLFILGTVLVIAHQMAATDVHDSGAQSLSVEALFLAESGLERAAQRYGAGTSCGAGLMEGAILFGRGEFEVIAPTPFLSSGRCVARIQGRVGNVSRTIEAQFVGGGAAGIAFDDTINRNRNDDTTASWNHRVTAALPNPILIVGVTLKNTAGQTVSTVTYNGVSLAPIGAAATATDVRVELWQLVNPPTGSNYPVEVTLAGASTAIVAGSVSLTGVNQTTPIEASTFTGGNSGSASASVTTASANAWVMDVMGSKTDGDADMIAAAGRAEQWNERAGPGGSGGVNRIRGAASTRGPIAAAGAVTMNWTLGSSQPWAMGAVAIKPATTGQVLAWTEIVN